MPAQYPDIGFPPGSEVSLLRRICNNTALIAESGGGGGGGISWVTPPASAASAGVAGQVAYDASYFYVCYGSGNWLRTPLSTW